jgi:hypothetical protein
MSANNKRIIKVSYLQFVKTSALGSSELAR